MCQALAISEGRIMTGNGAFTLPRMAPIAS
jgi:hypothetical protein